MSRFYPERCGCASLPVMALSAEGDVQVVCYLPSYNQITIDNHLNFRSCPCFWWLISHLICSIFRFRVPHYLIHKYISCRRGFALPIMVQPSIHVHIQCTCRGVEMAKAMVTKGQSSPWVFLLENIRILSKMSKLRGHKKWAYRIR